MEGFVSGEVAGGFWGFLGFFGVIDDEDGRWMRTCAIFG